MPAKICTDGYTSTGKFAYAQYTFEGFMDADLVGKIIGMVSSKYGKPTEQRGSYKTAYLGC